MSSVYSFIKSDIYEEFQSRKNGFPENFVNIIGILTVSVILDWPVRYISCNKL